MIWAITLVQTLLFIIIAPLFTGIVKWTKCKLQNRNAPSILQPYFNLNKLFRKEVLIATTTSSIFKFAPYIIFSINVFICMTVPLFFVSVFMGRVIDVIVIMGLFSLARFFLTLSGMDTGTAFGGMGASREMLISTFAEPVLLIIFFALSMVTMSTNLTMIIKYAVFHNLWLQPSIMLLAFSFILVTLAETGRVPVDNPATHLELTMIHEAMILEYSGRYLALIEWAAQIKLLLYAVLFFNLFFPLGIAQDLNWIDISFSILILILKLMAFIIAICVSESGLAKLRLFRAPYLLNLSFILGLFAVLMHIIIEVR